MGQSKRTRHNIAIELDLMAAQEAKETAIKNTERFRDGGAPH